MPSLAQDKQALDWLTQNPGDERAPAVAQKLGVAPQDVDAWQWANENGADMRAVQVRNRVFDKVAESRPTEVNEQGGEVTRGVPVDRLTIKNLLDGDPEAQKTFFEKKGYRTRTSTKGDLQVKAPGDSYYKAIDPEGIDRWDAADVLFDVGAGIGTGLAAGAIGAGALAGGPVGALAAGSAAGAVSGAATEVAKQGIANLAGARTGFNLPEIAKQGAIGAAVPVGLKVAGTALKATGKAIGKTVTWATGSGLKPNAAVIEEASEAIGAKATPGQLFEGEVVKKLEDAQRQSAGLMGGTFLRKQIDANIKAAKSTADSIVDGAAGKTQFDMGDEIGTKLKEAVTRRLQPAEEIYSKYEDELGEKVIDALPLNGIFAAAKTEARLNPDAVSAITKFESVLEQVKTIDDVKLLRSEIGSAASKATANKDWSTAKALSAIKDELTDFRSQSILNAFEGGPKGELVKAELQAADKIYASTIRDVENVIGKKITKGSPKRELQAFLDKTPEIARINKVLKTNDPKQIAKVREAFPEVFEAARAAKISEIAKRAQPGEEINPKELAKQIAALPPETKVLLFGDDAAKKADNLKIYLDSLPGKLVGPSGTPEGMRWLDLMSIINPMYYGKQALSLGTSLLSHGYTAAPMGKDVLSNVGRVAGTKAAAAGTTAAANAGLLIPKRKDGE